MLTSIREVLFVLVVFCAYTVEGITGFAGTMLAMPVSMMIIGVREAKLALNVVTLMVSALICIKTHKHINVKELIKIILLMLIGLVIGLWMFQVLPVSGLAYIYGIFIVIIAIRGLFVKQQKNHTKIVLIGIVLLAGVVHGLFLSGGSLLVIYAVIVLKDKSVIRATLTPVWLVLNTIILVQDIYFKRFTPHVVLLLVWCVIPIVAAVFLGDWLHKKVSQQFFVKLTYALLILSGLSLII